MSDDVAGFFYSPQHAAQQDRSASIWRQSHVCFCGRGAAATATERGRPRWEAEGEDAGGTGRPTVSHRSWRRVRATSRVGRMAIVSNRGGERLIDVLYIRRSLAWINAIVFGHVSEFQHIRVKTNLEAARMELHNAPHRWHMKSGDR
jgi:hypothetical protein